MFTKPFSMLEVWNVWNNSSQVFESAVQQYTEAKEKLESMGKTMIESEESLHVKELVEKISQLNVELGQALLDYNTKALTGGLTPVDE